MPNTNDRGLPNSSGEPAPRLPKDLLLVEDEVLITIDIENTLRQLGVISVRVATNVAQAMQAIDQRVPEFALLDVTLGRDTSLGIARRLYGLGVRFAFVTGYGDDKAFGGEFTGILIIRKPYSTEMLREALWGIAGDSPTP